MPCARDIREPIDPMLSQHLGATPKDGRCMIIVKHSETHQCEDFRVEMVHTDEALLSATHIAATSTKRGISNKLIGGACVFQIPGLSRSNQMARTSAH
jgi:hypothetical protein